MKTAVVLSCVALVALASGVALAQAANPPAHGSLYLSGGDAPTPRVVAVRSGGPIDISRTDPSCSGFAEAYADFALQYDAAPIEGTALGAYAPYTLHIYVRSAADTTLAVRTPSGRWVCSDDSNGHNPLVSFVLPESGVHEIWVGTFGESTTHDAELVITEGEPQW